MLGLARPAPWPRPLSRVALSTAALPPARAASSYGARRFFTVSAPSAAAVGGSTAGAASAAAARARRHGRAAPRPQPPHTLKRRPALAALGDRAARVARAGAGGGMGDGMDWSRALHAALADFEAEVDKPDERIDLARAAAGLALHAGPSLDVEATVLRPMARLGKAFRARVASTAALMDEEAPKQVRQHAQAGSLCAFMEDEGFAGSGRSPTEYYRAENSLLHRVLERKHGIPITLSLVYMKVGRAAGIDLRGISFRGHFLLGFGSGASAALLDAFVNRLVPQEQSDAIVQAIGGSLPRFPKSLFLMRMLRNLQYVYERDGNVAQAARIVQYAQRLEAKAAAWP